MFEHLLAPDLAVGVAERRGLGARQVIGDRPGDPIEGVDVFAEAVPPAVEGGVFALARLEELRRAFEDDGQIGLVVDDLGEDLQAAVVVGVAAGLRVGVVGFGKAAGVDVTLPRRPFFSTSSAVSMRPLAS